MLRFFTFLFTALLVQPAFAEQNRYSADYLQEFQDESQDYSRNSILEFWGYHNNYGGQNNYTDTLRLRYYHPVHYDAFKGMVRLDTTANISPNSNSSNSALLVQPGSTMLTAWGNHPDFLPNWGGNIGGRVIFPFGNGSQWAIGPQFGMSFKPEKGNNTVLADFSPLVRYMFGIYQSASIASNSPNPLRELQMYPTLGFKLGPQTQIRIWDENGILYSTSQGTWFVPIDAMVTHRINKNLLVAIGASKQLIQTYTQYNWVAYGKVSVTF